jgi:hypothetical protein
MHSSEGPYAHWNVIYPPLVVVLYFIIGRSTLPFVDVPPGELSSFVLRDSQMGLMTLFIITLLSFYMLHLIYSKLMKDVDVRTVQKELMFLFVILLALPFLFAVERGNNIIFTLVFCFIFVLGYRSENKWIRYASYIALGCATGFKIYPAILWLLMLRERRYKEAGICAVIVMALLFLPFVFTDGNPLMLFSQVASYSSSNAGFISIHQHLTNILEALGFSNGTVSIISYAVISIFTLLSFIVILFDREMKFWKVLALISCNLILGLGVGVQYQIIYMAVPILYFLASEKTTTKENVFYVISFAMTVALIPGIMGGVSQNAVATIESVFVLLIAIVLLYEGLMRLYRKRSVKRENPAVS